MILIGNYIPLSFVVWDDVAGGSSVISCKLYSFRTSWIAANSFNPKFWSLNEKKYFFLNHIIVYQLESKHTFR